MLTPPSCSEHHASLRAVRRARAHHAAARTSRRQTSSCTASLDVRKVGTATGPATAGWTGRGGGVRVTVPVGGPFVSSVRILAGRAGKAGRLSGRGAGATIIVDASERNERLGGVLFPFN
uniref:Uncharacterized protein n=1 Tax=Cryptomonas curvata TaxID=233186 RepID=A0A7S0QPF8_9CRYP